MFLCLRPAPSSVPNKAALASECDRSNISQYRTDHCRGRPYRNAGDHMVSPCFTDIRYHQWIFYRICRAVSFDPYGSAKNQKAVMNFHHTQNTCLSVRLISCLADMRSISVQRQVFLFSRLCSIPSRPDLDHILIVVFQGCRGFNVFISFPIPHFPWIAIFFICSVFPMIWHLRCRCSSDRSHSSTHIKSLPAHPASGDRSPRPAVR